MFINDPWAPRTVARSAAPALLTRGTARRVTPGETWSGTNGIPPTGTFAAPKLGMQAETIPPLRTQTIGPLPVPQLRV